MGMVSCREDPVRNAWRLASAAPRPPGQAPRSGTEEDCVAPRARSFAGRDSAGWAGRRFWETTLSDPYRVRNEDGEDAGSAC